MNGVNVESAFGSLVPDKCMVDRERLEIFDRVGRTRSLFAQTDNWQWLDEALAQASADLLVRTSKDQWQDEGGVYQKGRPYCRMRSKLAEKVVKDLAARDGGLLWHDHDGEDWAVRLFPARNGQDLVGISVSFPGTSHDSREGVGKGLGSMRLSRRAEQFLWLLHGQVLQERRSEIRIADHTFAQLVWGESRDTWPKDWRREIKQTFRSLRRIHFELLRIPSCGWEPRLGSFTSAVVGFTDLTELGRINGNTDACNPACRLYGTGISHGHFLIQVGPGFLGALDGFALRTDERGVRHYDFSERENPASKELAQYRDDGGTPSIHLPSKIFGPASWSGLSQQLRDVLFGVLGEVTRASRSRRPDRAAIVRRRLAPGTSPKEMIECPFLDTEEQYIAFGGNGKRSGLGYRVVGKYGTGWLHKCGFDVGSDLNGVGKACRDFLGGLEQLGELFGFRVAAIDQRSKEWQGLDAMRATARRKFGWEALDELTLRVYAPVDYLDRLRSYFAEQGGFDTIPGFLAEPNAPTVSSLDVGTRIKLAGLRQEDVARKIGCSQPFLSNMLNGRKPWPPKFRQRAEQLLRAAEGGL